MIVVVLLVGIIKHDALSIETGVLEQMCPRGSKGRNATAAIKLDRVTLVDLIGTPCIHRWRVGRAVIPHDVFVAQLSHPGDPSGPQIPMRGSIVEQLPSGADVGTGTCGEVGL